MITHAGKPHLARLLAGDPSLKLGLAVGAGLDTETPGDCHLAADGDPSQAWHMPLDSGFPYADGGHLVAQATCRREHARFDWREFGLFAAESEIMPHYALSSTSDRPLLISRKVLLTPLHPVPKGDVHWVFRVRFTFA